MSGRAGDRVRIALLVSPFSFESFYSAHLGLDRRHYVDDYRNDFVWSYTEALRAHGVDVITYVPSHGEEGLDEAADGFRVRFLPLRSCWRWLESALQLAKTPVERYALEAAQAQSLLSVLRIGMEADGIDVLYVQEYWTGRFDVLARASPVPVVAGEHGGSSGLHVDQFKRGALRCAAAITVQSTAERQRLGRYGCAAELVTNGVDSRFFTPDPSVERPRRVLVVARLADGQKRISDLIAAVSRLPVPWALDIVGRGPDEDVLREVARRSGCADRVLFHGWVGSREELREFYRRCGVFALPSVWEAVTLALIEAMACGAAPVVTPLPAFRDIVHDGENGLFVNSESPEQLAEALLSAYADHERLGAAARRTVEARYDRDTTMASLAGILQAAAAAAPERGGRAVTAPDDLPFTIVDGSISRADQVAGLAGRLRRIAGLGRLVDARPTQHMASARAQGRLVRETSRYIANELRGAGGVRAYTLRRSDQTVLLRHGTVDTWTFTELFVLRLYQPPDPVAAMLAGVREPVVLDLGANIGLFGLDALQRYPGARITAYEPDPESAAIHSRLISLNGLASRWRLVEACAGPRTGTVAFLPGQETESRIVEESASGTLTLPIHDVLPAFAAADLVKVDIEGGEWPLLADPRFAGARAVVLEYHPPGCPDPDTHGTARRLLEDHGYEVLPLFRTPGGVGMVWAFRSERH